jgi:Family of unknown function (DUF6169)
MPVSWRVTKRFCNAVLKNGPKTMPTLSDKEAGQKRRLNSVSEIKKEEALLLRYPLYTGRNNNEYTFNTESRVTYEVEFRPTPYLFDEGSAFLHHVVELIIRVSVNSVNQYPALDKRVAMAISDSVADYFKTRSEAIAIYVCDSSDGRQAARKRKFDDWFRYFNQAEFIKHDLPVTDKKDGVVYYNSIILKANNPFRADIVNEFDLLFGRYNDPK